MGGFVRSGGNGNGSCGCQEENKSLDGQFIDFQSQMLKVKDWLGRTENALTPYSSPVLGKQSGSPHAETLKVSLCNCSCCLLPCMRLLLLLQVCGCFGLSGMTCFCFFIGPPIDSLVNASVRI